MILMFSVLFNYANLEYYPSQSCYGLVLLLRQLYVKCSVMLLLLIVCLSPQFRIPLIG